MNKLYGNPTRAPFNDSPTFFVCFFFYYFCKGLSSLPSSSNPEELFLQAASPPPPPSLTIINFCLGCCSLSTPTPPLPLFNDDAASQANKAWGVAVEYIIEELHRGRPSSFPLCVHSPACLQFPFHHHIVGCATYACMQQCIQQNRKPRRRRRRRRTHATNKPPPPIVINNNKCSRGLHSK